MKYIARDSTVQKKRDEGEGLRSASLAIKSNKQTQFDSFTLHRSYHILIMTRIRVSAIATILAAVILSIAEADPTPASPEPFDCSKIDIDGHKYDISAFKPKYE